VIGVPAIYLALRFYVRTIERRPLHELASGGVARELAMGLAVGGGVFGAGAGGLALGGGAFGHRGPGVGALPPLVGMAAISSFSEEVLVRGIVFRITEEALGSGLALLVSAALFGLGHLANPHATLWGAAAIALEAGVLLAAAYMLTRRLWLPIGIHAAWNFTEGGLFGAATSGRNLPGLLQTTTRGPEWLSGGAFGA